jgi:TonB family protein
MRRIVPVFLLTAVAFPQTAPLRIPADEAAKHLVTGNQPDYPQLAQQARIQGNVILETRIDESGSAVDIRLVKGHPMLVTAAIQAVRHWKYQPIQVDGKPVSVMTDILITFGDKKYYASAGRADLAFRYDFWSAEDAAKAAIARKDYPAAEQQLNRAQQALGAGGQHPQEQWDWLTTSGRLRALQQKYDQAEQYLNDALALESHAQESTVTALSLSNLGALFADEKKLDLAHQKSSEALSIYENNFKQARDEVRRKALGQAIAGESLRLLKIAQAQSDETEKASQCQTLGKFEGFLSQSQRDSVSAACPSLKLGP